MYRLQQGDLVALERLFRRYSLLILSIALRILRDRTEAQDVLQEVFLSVLRRGDRFDSARGTVASWLLQIAYSKALNRRKRRLLDSYGLQGALREADRTADAAQHPLTEVLSTRKVVRFALMELSTDQRETLYMYFFEGYSLLEVSRKRNQTFGNTRHHYYRGMAALRSLLKFSDSRGFLINKRTHPQDREGAS